MALTVGNSKRMWLSDCRPRPRHSVINIRYAYQPYIVLKEGCRLKESVQLFIRRLTTHSFESSHEQAMTLLQGRLQGTQRRRSRLAISVPTGDPAMMMDSFNNKLFE